MSPVLTRVGNTSFMSESDTFWLVWLTPGGQTPPPTDLHAKWLKWRGFTQGCAFCSIIINRNFWCPLGLISRASTRSKYGKCLNKNFLLDLAFKIRGPRREHPLSSEPKFQWKWHTEWTMSGEKLKYHVLHRGTHHVISRMRNDDSTLCLWAHEVWVPKNVPPIGNGQCRVEWLRDRWKVKVVTQICLVLSKPWVKLVRKPKPVLGTSTRTRINVNVAQFNSAFICLLLAGAISLPRDAL